MTYINPSFRQSSAEYNTNDKKVRSVGGSLLGLTTGAIVANGLPYKTGPFYMDKMLKFGTFDKETTEQIQKGYKQIIKDTGLDKKGVRIKFLSSNKRRTNLSNKDILKELVDAMYIQPVKIGQNAFFVGKDFKLPKITYDEIVKLQKEGNKKLLDQKLKEFRVYIKKNSIILPDKKLSSAGFHEIGHALNYNFSKIGKFFQQCRPLSMLGPMILAFYVGCSKKSKAKEDEALNNKQKIHNFIRNNAVGFAALTTLPMLIEEGMATAKGQKLAKKILKPEVAQKVLKGNLAGYATYLTTAVGGILGVLAVKCIKDAFIKNKEYKIEAEKKIIEAYNSQLETSTPEPHISND